MLRRSASGLLSKLTCLRHVHTCEQLEAQVTCVRPLFSSSWRSRQEQPPQPSQRVLASLASLQQQLAAPFSAQSAKHRPPPPDSQPASDSAEQEAAAAAEAAAEGSRDEAASASEPSKDAVPQSPEELAAALSAAQEALARSEEEAADLRDSMMRTLADMENLRGRSARQAENAQKFALQGFVKSLLDVADNLERAWGSVEAEARGGDKLDRERAVSLLHNLLDGVKLTDKIFQQALRSNGVEQYDPLGERFDPNLHNALFQAPDPSREPGTVAIVSKKGYKLNDRVLRAAEVGIVPQPQE